MTGAASATAACGMVAGTASARPAHAPSQAGPADGPWIFQSNGQPATWTVPEGVYLVEIVAQGGSGGGFGGGTYNEIEYAPVAGGPGAVVDAMWAVTPGQQLLIDVGANGSDVQFQPSSTGGYSRVAPGGRGGYESGQDLYYPPYAAGGGGGATTVSDAAAPNDMWLVAGGGGGVGNSSINYLSRSGTDGAIFPWRGGAPGAAGAIPTAGQPGTSAATSIPGGAGGAAGTAAGPVEPGTDGGNGTFNQNLWPPSGSGGGGGGGAGGGQGGQAGGQYVFQPGGGGGGAGASSVDAAAMSASITTSPALTPQNASTPTVTITPQEPPPPTFTAATPPPAVVGTAYSYAIFATSVAPVTYSVLQGTLPPGITLATDGILSGTSFVEGTFAFTVTAWISGTGWAASNFQDVTLVVEPVPSAPAFTAEQPPSQAVIGEPYSYTFSASGYPSPTFTVSSGSLPSGLSLVGATLSGTPTTLGTSGFVLTASNSSGSVTTPSLGIEVVPDALTVTFQSEGGSTVAPVQVTYGQTVPKPPDPTFDTYTFLGWFTTAGAAYDFDTPVTENLTLLAHWDAGSFDSTQPTKPARNGGGTSTTMVAPTPSASSPQVGRSPTEQVGQSATEPRSTTQRSRLPATGDSGLARTLTTASLLAVAGAIAIGVGRRRSDHGADD